MEHRKLSDHSSVKKTEDPYHVYYENYLDTNACTECTGLMPNAAHNREEWDAYREIFDFTDEHCATGKGKVIVPRTEKPLSAKDSLQETSGN